MHTHLSNINTFWECLSKIGTEMTYQGKLLHKGWRKGAQSSGLVETKTSGQIKRDKKKSANTTTEGSSKAENHAYIVVGPKNFDPLDEEATSTLVITSGHNHKAFGVLQLTDLIHIGKLHCKVLIIY
jgi:hypothetical protein